MEKKSVSKTTITIATIVVSIVIIVFLILEILLGYYMYSVMKKDFHEAFLKKVTSGVCKEEIRKILKEPEFGNYKKDTRKYERSALYIEFLNSNYKGKSQEKDPVWFTEVSRIPLESLQEFCEATVEYCPQLSNPRIRRRKRSTGISKQIEISSPGRPNKIIQIKSKSARLLLPEGLTGAPGLPGLPGPKGDPGVPGSDGSPGEVGPIGWKGDKGDRGAPGLNGPPGEVGPIGWKGDKGDRGVPGLNGLNGPPGEVGPIGWKGAPGARGLSGLPGFRGPKGEKGEVGEPKEGQKCEDGLPGPAGIKGEKGDFGKEGQKGDVGPAGPPGQKGVVGPAGPPGERGGFGFPGFIGEKGFKGNPGIDGLPGMKGEPGEPGIPGAIEIATPPPKPRLPGVSDLYRSTWTSAKYGNESYQELSPRVKECVLQTIGEPQKRAFIDSKSGAWIMDSESPDTDEVQKAWVTIPSEPDILFEYTKISSSGSEETYVLNPPFQGNSQTVYKQFFYYQAAEKKFSITKYSLSNKTTETLQVPGLTSNNSQILYSTGLNYLDFSVDENGLWVIFAVPETNNTGIMKIDAETFKPLYIWNITVDHHMFKEMFVASGILYAIDHIDGEEIRVSHVIDLYTGKTSIVDIDIVEKFGQTSMAAYEYKSKKLMTWNMGYLVSYPVTCKDIKSNEVVAAPSE